MSKKNSIPPDMAASQYLPADYADTFEHRSTSKKQFSADDIQIALWTISPAWVNSLMRLRDFLVKPLGLKPGASEGDKKRLAQSIRAGTAYRFMSVSHQSPHETILCLNDTHLQAWVSVSVTNPTPHTTLSRVATIVIFHNLLGRLYFYLIYPFHKLVVPSMLRHAIKHCTQNSLEY